MPGERLEDALDAAERLSDEGLPSVVTLLGENVTGPDEARQVVDRYREALAAIDERGGDVYPSIKPTHLGLDLGSEVAETNLRALAADAGARGRPVILDMEATPYVDRTLALHRRLREEGSDVGICLQSYLRRTPDDLEAMLPLRPRVRLVKGAYAEPPELAFPRKADVDAAFLSLARRLLEAVRAGDAVEPAFGTHDARLLRAIDRIASELGVGREAWEAQMLYGIRRELQRELAAEGVRVRVLISYGGAWFPWYMRRLAERPANVWFVVRTALSP
jgi:proline dehydrogenase